MPAKPGFSSAGRAARSEGRVEGGDLFRVKIIQTTCPLRTRDVGDRIGDADSGADVLIDRQVRYVRMYEVLAYVRSTSVWS